MNYFDWAKAVEIIKSKGIKSADAGLAQDWFWTGATLLEDGKPKDGAYLSSSWASPVLRVYNDDGSYTDYPCQTKKKTSHKWTPKYKKLLAA